MLCRVVLGLGVGVLLISEADFGDTWTTLNRVTTATLNRLSFVDSFTGWVVGNGGTILRTTDGGDNWEVQSSNTTHNLVEVLFINDRHGWALAQVLPDTTPDYGTILLSTSNGGQTWSGRWFPEEMFRTVFFFDSLRGLMAGELGKIVGTTDGGVHWSPKEIDSSNVGHWAIRRIRFFSEQFGFGVGGRFELLGVVWRTTNGGERWSPQTAGADPILDIHCADSLNCLGISGGFDDGSSLVRTSDGGDTWEYEFIGLWGEPRALSFRTASEGWAPLGFAGTAMFTLDSGKTWSEYFTPDTTAMYDLVFTDSLTGFMVGDGGTILKYQPGPVYVAEGGLLHQPVAIVIHPNYPNPFNPSTMVVFELPSAGDVTIKFYDVTGREVRNHNIGRREAGVHRLRVQGDDLTSGVYMYRVTLVSHTGSQSATGKIVLVR